MIKAIETVFDGHKFRSRLEARWAVVFKELRWKYEYELEGFDVGGGFKYLPDFYLPAMRLFLEVKPSQEMVQLKDIEKITRLASDPDRRVVLIVGTPGDQEMFVIPCYANHSWSEIVAEHESDFEFCREVFFENLDRVTFGAIPFDCENWHVVYAPMMDHADATFSMALQNGKQARFEHGRSGN